MATVLLIVIYIAFISLGLPDSVLGSAWPSMYMSLGASVSAQGILSMLTAAGTIISSFMSERIIRRFGTGTITAVSVLITATALFGFSLSGSFLLLCLCAFPLGLGAGSVDAALNNYVANHYKAWHMNWLHCFWGIGAMAGPFIMSYFIGGGDWHSGYLTVSLVQFAIVFILFLSLPLWKKGDSVEADSVQSAGERRTFRELIGIRGVKSVLMLLFCYYALEATAGIWGTTFLVMSRGVSEETAAKWISFFYLGIMAGRFVSGFMSLKMSCRLLIKIGIVVAGAGICMLVIPSGGILQVGGLFMIGFGCAPIYPCILHQTPEKFGYDASQSLMGIQMGFAYIGQSLMPPLCGLLLEHVSAAIFPYYMLVFWALMILMIRISNK